MIYNNIEIKLLEHDTVIINYADKTIYADPFKLPREQPLRKANLVLITHPHFDHCSIEDLKIITNKETTIITVPDAQSKLMNLEVKEIILTTPGKKHETQGITIESINAYNNNKEYHPKENEWVGFIITINETRIYIPGDTDLIPEMKELTGTIDIAFLPVSGTYVMNAEEAAKAAEIIKPKIAIPYHYGSIVGTINDAEVFKKLAEEKGIKTEILPKN